jgi:Flp pilus assembly protein TadD
LAAGEKALRVHPDNLNTLLTMAPVIANHVVKRPDRAKLLAQAEGYARRALQGIERTKVPRKIPLEHWELEKQRMQAQAREVLGVVAIERGQPQTAITEFETAVRLASKPEGVQFYRLGLAYALADEKVKAEKVFRRAAELGPDPVRKRALGEIERLAGKGPAPGSSDSGICP